MPLLALFAAPTAFSAATLKFSLHRQKASTSHLCSSHLDLVAAAAVAADGSFHRPGVTPACVIAIIRCAIIRYRWMHSVACARVGWCFALLCFARFYVACESLRRASRTEPPSSRHRISQSHQTSSAGHSRLQQPTSGKACPQTGSCSASMLPSGSLHVSERHARVISRAAPMRV